MTDFDVLLEDAQAGDPVALQEIYATNAPLVYGYLRGQNASSAEDVTSEVFVGMMRGLAGFEGDEHSFRSWLLVIAHRRLLDERRGASRRKADAFDPARLIQLGTSSGDEVEAEAIGRVRDGSVYAALAALSDSQRSVVLLHAVGGMSLSEIADVLGKRLGAVKSLHRRGLGSLARELARLEPSSQAAEGA